MSIHVCKCEHNGCAEFHLRYPGLTEEAAQYIADRINAGDLLVPCAAPYQEPNLPEFSAQLDYDKDFNVLVSVYQRRADAAPLLVHQEALKSQEPAAPAPVVPEDKARWSKYVAGVIGCYLNIPDEDGRVDAIAGIIERRLWALPTAPAPVVQWPTMPPSKGQSPVLFEDGYAEGWAKCLQAIKELHSAQTINNQEYPRQWHEGVDAALEALQRLTTANESAGLDYENTAPVVDEREAFEAWVPTHHKLVSPGPLARMDGNGCYFYGPVEACWKAWQARAALASKEKP